MRRIQATIPVSKVRSDESPRWSKMKEVDTETGQEKAVHSNGKGNLLAGAPSLHTKFSL